MTIGSAAGLGLSGCSEVEVCWGFWVVSSFIGTFQCRSDCSLVFALLPTGIADDAHTPHSGDVEVRKIMGNGIADGVDYILVANIPTNRQFNKNPYGSPATFRH